MEGQESKKKIVVLFTSSRCEIRHLHVVAVQWRQRTSGEKMQAPLKNLFVRFWSVNVVSKRSFSACSKHTWEQFCEKKIKRTYKKWTISAFLKTKKPSWRRGHTTRSCVWNKPKPGPSRFIFCAFHSSWIPKRSVQIDSAIVEWNRTDFTNKDAPLVKGWFYNFILLFN